MFNVKKEIIDYIENNIFPEYSLNEESHGIKHIKNVIQRSFEIIDEFNLTLDSNLVYVIASYHDLGHHIDYEHHEIYSAKLFLNNPEILNFFNKREIKLIEEAILDHRSSCDHEPRNIYGKIISSADRSIDYINSLKRNYIYYKNHFSNMTNEDIINLSYEHKLKKYGKENGFGKMYFKDAKYLQYESELKKLVSSKENFTLTFKKVNNLLDK